MTADRWATRVAWATAAVVHLGVLVLLWKMHRPTETALRLPEGVSARRLATHARRRQDSRERQRSRVLPAEHARKLMEQSELLVRRELHLRLDRFGEIANSTRQREEVLLERIERRPAAADYRNEVNSTVQARANNGAALDPLGSNTSIQSLYERLAELEDQILVDYTDAEAAKLALRRGQSYPAVRALLKPNTVRMPAYQELVAEETGARKGVADHEPAMNRLVIRTIDDLNTYRRVLQRSSRESSLAETRLLSLTSAASRRAPGGWGKGSGSGDGMAITYGGKRGSEASKEAYRPTLDSGIVQAQALPGRRFSRNSTRRGWLYINTWYMIGPWDNFGRSDFAIIHPPELNIDFDAVYTDGQNGVGIAERDAHPIEMRGEKVRLDGTLRWKFMQSESIHNVPPVTSDWSTYYAYTELYFEEQTEMIVAIGTDDSGKVWINGEEIWQDRGMSWYRIDEHMQPFRFKKGVNRVLVRLENDGGGATGFSFLVCPREALRQVK